MMICWHIHTPTYQHITLQFHRTHSLLYSMLLLASMDYSYVVNFSLECRDTICIPSDHTSLYLHPPPVPLISELTSTRTFKDQDLDTYHKG